jgi:hypothetical protein
MRASVGTVVLNNDVDNILNVESPEAAIVRDNSIDAYFDEGK